MKKMISILFAFICILGLSACSGSKIEDNAIKDYQRVMNKTQSINSGHLDGKMLFTADKEDINAKISFNGDFIAQAKPQLAFELSVAANGVRLDNLAKAYMKDNNIYVNVLEQQKMMIPMDTKLLGSTNNTKKSVDTEAIKKGFKTLTITKDGDNSVIKGSLSDALLIEMKDQFKSTYNQNIGVKNISSVEVEFTSNKDNLLKNVRMKINVTYDVDKTSLKDGKEDTNNQEVVMDIEMILNLSNHNDVKSITFPNFKGYKKNDLDKDSKDILNQIKGNYL